MSPGLAALLHPLNILIVALQLAVLVDALRTEQSADQRRLARQAAAPSLLTGLGILGTFGGILLGLLSFDIGDIQGSIPRLLGGMTTAFTTSVVGLTLALGLRWAYRYFDRFQTVREATGHSISDVYTAIHELSSSMKADSQALRAELERLRVVVGGDGDSSLTTQTKLLRTETRDRLDELARLFTQFATQVSELGTKALIEALSNVISDFNTKLSEQFGENFKQLNEAVFKLVQWQENYASSVAVMEEQFRLAATGITESRTAIDRITKASEVMPGLVAKASESLGNLETQGRLLNDQLGAFAAIAEQATNSLPAIDATITQLTTGVASSVDNGLRLIADAQREQRAGQAELAKAYRALLSDVQTAVNESQSQVVSLRETINASLSTLETQLREHHARAAQNWERTLTDAIESSDNVMQQQVKNLDQTLGKELEKAVSLLGSHLLGLHEKLVSDYTPLLESMRRVVEVARRAEGPR